MEVSARRCHPELSGLHARVLGPSGLGQEFCPGWWWGAAQSHLSLASGACHLQSLLCRLFCCVTHFWEAPAHCSLLGLVSLAVGAGPWSGTPWHGLLLFPAYLTKWTDHPKTPTFPWGQLTHLVGFGTSVTSFVAALLDAPGFCPKELSAWGCLLSLCPLPGAPCTSGVCPLSPASSSSPMKVLL